MLHINYSWIKLKDNIMQKLIIIKLGMFGHMCRMHNSRRIKESWCSGEWRAQTGGEDLIGNCWTTSPNGARRHSRSWTKQWWTENVRRVWWHLRARSLWCLIMMMMTFLLLLLLHLLLLLLLLHVDQATLFTDQFGVLSNCEWKTCPRTYTWYEPETCTAQLDLPGFWPGTETRS